MTKSIAHAALVQEQRQLLQALFGSPADAADLPLLQSSGSAAGQTLQQRGLLAYRSHGAALAERALAAAFPVTLQLLGAENFAPLARQFWRRHPPCHGDIAQWGNALPAFIDAAPQLVDAPFFLGDVARVEWALHRAAFAADSALATASFELLGTHAPEDITLTFSAGVAMLASAFPVVSLVHAHAKPDAYLTQARAQLAAGQGETALIWRQGFKPQVSVIHAATQALMAALLGGQSLARALDAAAATQADFDFNGWLAHAVQSALFTGAKRL